MANVTKKFSRDYLTEELGLPNDPDTNKVTILSDEITGHRRWSVDHTLIFRLADQPIGEAWRTGYSVGATESQDEGPWEHYGEEIAAVLVRETEKTIKVYEPVPA